MKCNVKRDELCKEGVIYPKKDPSPCSWCGSIWERQVFTEYFKELEEESIQDNFVVVYELLDELMDFGFPQTTDSKILQE